MSNKLKRRTFLNRLGISCASVGATTLLSGITNMGLINSAAAANMSNSFFAPQANDYKALVCILLNGGNDSFNMLVPRGINEYNDYAATRTNLAIDRNDLLPINPLNSDGKLYGLHPGMSKTQSLFESGNLAFIANTGTLVQPTTMIDFQGGNNIPAGLFSHSDQAQHWQTSLPQDRNAATGWAGRMADILHENNINQNISMNISLGGVNQFQRGRSVQPYTISSQGNGAVQINQSNDNSFYETLKRQTLDSLLEDTYSSVLKEAFKTTVTNAIGSSFEFSSAISDVAEFNTDFSDGGISPDLKMIAKTIAARNTLNVSRQTFFLQSGRWDNHDNNLENHANNLQNVDTGLHEFYNVLTELGLENKVTTFIISDFGRKLVSNGNGSDHGWGGNTIVMGGAVNGKNIYGSYPDLYVNSPLDIGGGRFIPTTGTDEFFAELALWFGASSADLYQILPNLPNFWTPSSNNYPIGFMS